MVCAILSDSVIASHALYEIRIVILPNILIKTMGSTSPVRFTIVSPSFNQGPFLAETLDSIIAQDYPHLDHIVADGGSDDETKEVLAHYEARYTLEWFSEPDNGLYDALNKALRKSRGDWVGWINCDDLYPPGVLHAVADAIDAHSDVNIICGDAEVFERSNGTTRTLYTDHHYAGPRFEANDANLRIAHLNACFFRKSLLDNVGSFDTDFRIVGDRDYMFRIMKLAPASVHLGRVLCRYRAHPHSLTMSDVSEEKQAPLAPADSPAWRELQELCERYRDRDDVPQPIHTWCRTVLARHAVKKAAADLLQGRLLHFAKSSFYALRLRTRSLAWLLLAIAHNVRKRHH